MIDQPSTSSASDFAVQPCIEPSREIVQQYIAAFDEAEEDIESAIQSLITEYPTNSDLKGVLLKATVINQLYSTHIYGIRQVAHHIFEIGPQLDEWLAEGNALAVEKIADVNFGDKKVTFFSFATKYCSWHRPDHYPIYDSRVETFLWQLCQAGAIAKYRRNTPYKYEAFRERVRDARKQFGFEDLNFKNFDKFMYGQSVGYAIDAPLPVRATL